MGDWVEVLFKLCGFVGREVEASAATDNLTAVVGIAALGLLTWGFWTAVSQYSALPEEEARGEEAEIGGSLVNRL